MKNYWMSSFGRTWLRTNMYNSIEVRGRFFRSLISSLRPPEQGSVILLVLLVSAIFAVLAPVAGTLALSEARIARSHAVQNTALYIAEAGVELAIARLREEPGFTTPTGNPIRGELNGGSFAVEIISETPGPGEVGRRRITATGRWGGGQHQAAARVTFSPAPLQSFLFQHTFLSGGTAEIRGSVISGPVRVQALHKDSEGNTFDSDMDQIFNEQVDKPVEGEIADSLIPPVDFGHYRRLAVDNPSLWHVTPSRDLDEAIREANRLGRRRILLTSDDDDKGKVTLDEPVSFSGLIVIQAREVSIRRDINAAPHQNNPLVILTTGDIDVPTGQGHRVDTLGNNTLLYSNGRVEIERSEGGGVRQMSGIVVAKGGNKDSELRNTNLAYNNAMLHLLQQDAQPDFPQQAAGTVMNITFINPQP
ncbi:MAG: hypothetical protein DDT21_01187 [Syntrophomonadaceae bacterium]|nr:hypothetical protein [Bacillota bacterium]